MSTVKKFIKEAESLIERAGTELSDEGYIEFLSEIEDHAESARLAFEEQLAGEELDAEDEEEFDPFDDDLDEEA